MPKQDCYKCEYRGEVPGDAHSCCNHPSVECDPWDAALAFIKRRGSPLDILANEHGVSHGWFIWPVNFDPVWLENCEGFKEKS